MDSLSLIAFHLPQYHPIPENDEWWGAGFTEWTNVSRAKPHFSGHDQPHLPSDLGFYDLRLPESRDAQASLAREYGVQGFCYYHYWFNGKRLLERPVNEILTSGKPDFPFCLCWANEPWSRRWLGEERDVLMPQAYSAEDDANHARWLAKAFSDPRYIKQDGRPLFLIYRPKDHPEPLRLIKEMRIACEAVGVGNPYLVGIDAHCPGFDFRTVGFDSSLSFAPQLGWLPDAFREGFLWRRLKKNLEMGCWDGTSKIYRDKDVREIHSQRRPKHPHIPCAFVGWDNTPRRGKSAIVVKDGSPEAFGQDLSDQIKQWKSTSPQVPYFFINAWNEWAEGNHLEPDQRNGLKYLETMQKVLNSFKRSSPEIVSGDGEIKQD